MIDWSAYRVPANYRDKVLRENPPLSEEEFENEYDSPYMTKKYHYNYRWDSELTEENLQKTFVNLCTSAFFHNKDKTVREDTLNLDALNSEEKKEVMYKMKRQLEELGELPLDKDSFFTNIGKVSPLQTQFKIWKKNLFIPLDEQLREHAERKVKE